MIEDFRTSLHHSRQQRLLSKTYDHPGNMRSRGVCYACESGANVNVSAEMYRRVVEAVPEGIWVVNPQGLTMFSNRRMAKILGIDFESMPNQSCFDRVYPAELEDAQRLFARALGGDSQPFDFRLRRGDGSPIWVSISCMPVHDESGNQIGLLGLFPDITERRQAEAALRESEEPFRNVADTAPVMIWVTGPDKLFTFFNKTWLDFTGRRMEQELGNGWAEGIHPDDRHRCYDAFCSAFDAWRNLQIECRLRRRDGEYRSVLCTGVPRFAPGEVSRATLVRISTLPPFKVRSASAS